MFFNQPDFLACRKHAGLAVLFYNPKKNRVGRPLDSAQLMDVTANSGLHWHGLVLKNLLSPLHEPLDYIEEGLRK
jgi:hypothetical protein